MPANHSLASRDSVAFADLRNDEIVGMPMDPMLQTQIAGTSEGPVKPPLFRYQVSNGDAVRLLVAAGFGIAIQPACLVRQYETLLNIRGVPLSDTWATRQQRIIVRDSRSLSTGPSLFLRHVLLAGTGRISPSTNASFRNSQTSSGGGLACLK
jgi:DNA-binding transcriptional LysR family regulator